MRSLQCRRRKVNEVNFALAGDGCGCLQAVAYWGQGAVAAPTEPS